MPKGGFIDMVEHPSINDDEEDDSNGRGEKGANSVNDSENDGA